VARDPALILARYSEPVPRYTSYPTAPHFETDLGPTLLPEMLGAIGQSERVSLYIHVPYCDRLCWFCGCHTKHTRQYGPVADYVASLLREVALVSRAIGFPAPVAQLHFGGGSPSLMRSGDFQRLSDALHEAFTIDAASEISVEIDPSDVTDDTLDGLTALGMTRASIGVQDFDPAVQAAINRPQSFELTREVIASLRAIGIGSLNIDALYGLPLQTEQRLAATLEKVVDLAPDRIALFGYAHMPWLKKHQTMIRDEDLPDQTERFRQARLAEAALVAAGYAAIGIDHFALPHDTLAEAARTGTLHRNFQGYTTDACATMIGLGASSIGRFRDGYVQNIVPTASYRAAVDADRLPVGRGYRLSDDDRVRAYWIERLMCDFAVCFADLEARFGAAAAPYIAEARMIATSDADGLCRVEADRFVIPDDARPFTRIVAARFDAHLKTSAFRYSKAV